MIGSLLLSPMSFMIPEWVATIKEHHRDSTARNPAMIVLHVDQIKIYQMPIERQDHEKEGSKENNIDIYVFVYKGLLKQSIK